MPPPRTGDGPTERERRALPDRNAPTAGPAELVEGIRTLGIPAEPTTGTSPVSGSAAIELIKANPAFNIYVGII